MEEKRDENRFSYVYLADEQAELKMIRDKYTQPTESEDKMERLRRLDRSVTQKASMLSIMIGVIGTLIFGMGMSLCMTDLSEAYEYAMLIGIVLGILGGAIAALSYPIYSFVLKRERKKIAPEIISLTDELIK